MDVVGANFENAVEEVRERLEGNPIPLIIPIGAGSIKDGPTLFVGVIDLLAMQALYFDPTDFGKTIRRDSIPEELQRDALAWREHMFDALTRGDDQDRIAGAYLEGKEVPRRRSGR